MSMPRVPRRPDEGAYAALAEAGIYEALLEIRMAIEPIEEIEEPGDLFEDLDTEPGSLRLPLQSFAREPHDGSSHSRCMTNCGTTRFHPATNRPLPAPRFSK